MVLGFLVLNIVLVEVVGITIELLVKTTIVKYSSGLIPVGLLLSKVVVVAVPPLPLRGVLCVALLAPRRGFILLVISSRSFVVLLLKSLLFSYRILSILLFLIFAFALTFLPFQGLFFSFR